LKPAVLRLETPGGPRCLEGPIQVQAPPRWAAAGTAGCPKGPFFPPPGRTPLRGWKPDRAGAEFGATCFGVGSPTNWAPARQRAAPGGPRAVPGTHLGPCAKPPTASPPMALPPLCADPSGQVYAGSPPGRRWPAWGQFQGHPGPGTQLWETNRFTRCITPTNGGHLRWVRGGSGAAARPLSAARPDGPSAFCPTLRPSLCQRPCCPELLSQGGRRLMAPTTARFPLQRRLTGAQIEAQEFSSRSGGPALAPPAAQVLSGGRAGGWCTGLEGKRRGAVLGGSMRSVRTFPPTCPAPCSSWFPEVPVPGDRRGGFGHGAWVVRLEPSIWRHGAGA